MFYSRRVVSSTFTYCTSSDFPDISISDLYSGLSAELREGPEVLPPPPTRVPKGLTDELAGLGTGRASIGKCRK